MAKAVDTKDSGYMQWLQRSDPDNYNGCPVCHGRGLMTCPAHGSKLDSDGWCDICSSPMDVHPIPLTTCHCQPL